MCDLFGGGVFVVVGIYSFCNCVSGKMFDNLGVIVDGVIVV